jgi:hypothetical protein
MTDWLDELDKLNQKYLSLQMEDSIGTALRLRAKKEELCHKLYESRHKLIDARKMEPRLLKELKEAHASELRSHERDQRVHLENEELKALLRRVFNARGCLWCKRDPNSLATNHAADCELAGALK